MTFVSFLFHLIDDKEFLRIYDLHHGSKFANLDKSNLAQEPGWEKLNLYIFDLFIKARKADNNVN